MTNSKSTKRALLSSVISLLLCFAMLMGTTFAWFTDSATSSGNIIATGTLDVELYKWTGEVTENRDNALGMGNSSEAVFPDVLWEPGHTQVVYLSIKNNGSLALKYKVALEVKAMSTESLLDVMSFAITPDAQFGDVTSWAGNGTYLTGTYTEGVGNAQDVTLEPGTEHFFALSVHMDEEAGNQYMNQSITFDVLVLAAQLTSENDSFGSNYDADATYPEPVITPVEEGVSAYHVSFQNLGSIKYTSDALPENAVSVTTNIVPTTYNTSNIVVSGTFTDYDKVETKSYEVTVTGTDGVTPVTVELKAEPGLDPATVKVYHYDEEVQDIVYNPNTGYVTFESATFSPFTVVYDVKSEFVAPEVPADEYPKAIVTPYDIPETIEWGKYGQWSPTTGLEANLDAAFKFACPDLTDDVKAAYNYWYCDFYVSLDRDLGENQIFLGGNYGSFGWVGFHNNEVILPANEEIGLLESVTTNPWTYADVERFVGEFVCGVGDVDGALEGATFTVKLRLTNPADSSDYIDVNVVKYTFGGTYTIQ